MGKSQQYVDSMEEPYSLESMEEPRRWIERCTGTWSFVVFLVWDCYMRLPHARSPAKTEGQLGLLLGIPDLAGFHQSI